MDMLSDSLTNTVGSEDYIPDTDGSFEGAHMRPVNGVINTP